MNGQFPLTGTTEEKIITCLKAAGWYKGRKIRPEIMEKVRAFYAMGGITLPAGAEKFLREFYGIAEGWYFNIPVKEQHGRGADVEFRLFPDSGNSKDYYNEELAYEYEPDLKTMSDFAGEPLVWIGDIGYYYPESIYMGSTRKIFSMRDDGTLHTYTSLTELFRWDFDHHPDWSFVTMRETYC